MERNSEKIGFHIGFCGVDGSGKSTQAVLLCRWLKDQGLNAIVYEERRNFVSEITDTIARGKGFVSGRAYLGKQLYMVCISFEVLRQNMLNIRPYTTMGIHIVSSRTVFDWLAGGLARECHPPEFNFAKEIILFRGIPDLTLWLDTSPDIAQERILKRKFDTADLNYLKKYRLSLESILDDYPHERIEGDDDIGIVQVRVKEIVEIFLKQSWTKGD